MTDNLPDEIWAEHCFTFDPTMIESCNAYKLPPAGKELTKYIRADSEDYVILKRSDLEGMKQYETALTELNKEKVGYNQAIDDIMGG